uniref:beta-glucosidase n=1 Tax=Carica papaya TaxID=3649 RepID=C9WCQ1_CARPA|nr:beta-thioglucoside glucohydrolase [Carica papaya]
MAIQVGFRYLFLLVLVGLLVCINGARNIPFSIINYKDIGSYKIFDENDLNRRDFPNNFIFGTATSAFQIEGVTHRAFNIWDSFTHRYPEKSSDGRDADQATDSYHLYKVDVEMMKNMGVNGYRFSIAWSRILPKGRISGGINKEGIEYYKNLIDELLSNDIEPFVTIFHWDLPQTLEDMYDGLLDRNFVLHYRDFANLCFKEFGNKVKYWITFNQPYSLAFNAYGKGEQAPGRCSAWMNNNCTGGDSGTEPYIVAYHELLAHAEVVQLYRREYKKTQKGNIGITLIANWYYPLRNTVADTNAAQRAQDFKLGWFLDPIIFGDYPSSMKKLVGKRLPQFAPWESKLLKGSIDFLGLNYYFPLYAFDTSAPDPTKPSVLTDGRFGTTNVRDGVPIGINSTLFYYNATGFYDLLTYLRNKYNNPLTYITENGYADSSTISLNETLADVGRIDYHKTHLLALKKAIAEGSNVAGYFAWSLLDNYEFVQGFTVRFGLNYVNYSDPSDRKPKASALWFTDFLNNVV